MWKLEPLGYDAAEVAPITAITSEPVVIGRKTGGIADIAQFVAIHKKHAELRDGGEGALLVRALGTQPVWRKPSSGLVQRFLATDGERRLHAGERLYLLHPESETPLGYTVARGAAAVAAAETAAAAPRAVAAAEAGTLRGRRLSFGVGTPVGEVVGEEDGGHVLVRFDDGAEDMMPRAKALRLIDAHEQQQQQMPPPAAPGPPKVGKRAREGRKQQSKKAVAAAAAAAGGEAAEAKPKKPKKAAAAAAAPPVGENSQRRTSRRRRARRRRR